MGFIILVCVVVGSLLLLPDGAVKPALKIIGYVALGCMAFVFVSAFLWPILAIIGIYTLVMLTFKDFGPAGK